MIANGTMSLAGVDARLGQDGRLRFIVPARVAGKPPQIIRMKIGTKIVELVAREKVLTVVINPDPNQYDEWLLDGEGTGFALLVRSPQTFDPEPSHTDND